MSIKQLRLNKGWTQEDLSIHSGLSARTIQRAERGHKVGAESLKCLAAVFDISIEELIQEQNMTESQSTEEDTKIKLNDREHSALTFGQSLFTTPKAGEKDPLTSVERKAVNYGKRILNKLKQVQKI